MSEQEWFQKDFYQTLGVAKDADAATIKKAYRKLARKWHPDQNPGDAQAEGKFKDIAEAYTVLSDAEQRQKYDAIRAMAGGGARFSAGSTRGGSGGFEDIFQMFSGGSRPQASYSTNSTGSFDDLFSGLFGRGGSAFSSTSGGSPFGAQAPHAPQPGQDLKAETTLTLRQAVSGTTLRMNVDGRSMTVRIPAGVRDGQKIRLAGKGRPSLSGGAAGNLVVTIHVSAHPVFLRDGDDLRMRVPISVGEALSGSQIHVPLIDGSAVTVKVPAGTSSGTVLRVRGRGVKRGSSTGDLLIELMIAVPEKLTAEQKVALDALNTALEGWNPRADLDHTVRS